MVATVSANGNGISGAGNTVTVVTFVNDRGTFSASKLESNGDPLVGTWTGRDQGTGHAKVCATFLADGTYFVTIDGDHAARPSSVDGVEFGTYSWNSSTGVFSHVPTVKTCASWGFGLDQAETDTLNLNGDTLALTAVGKSGLTLTRVLPDAGSTWISDTPATAVDRYHKYTGTTFLTNGTFFLAEANDASADTPGTGMERGTYSFDRASGLLTYSVTVDTNGLFGVSDGGITHISTTVTDVGSVGDGIVTGTMFNDVITGGVGNDTIDGGSGIDTATYSGKHSAYTLTATASGYTIRDNVGTDGTDTISNVERMQFSDTKLALDMGAALAGGEVALLIGAVVGRASLSDGALVGQLLSFFDGGYTLHDAANVLVNAGVMDRLAGGSSTNAYVNWIYKAVVGQTATADVTAALAPYIDSNGYSKADFLATVAALPLNQTNIGLVGLQQTGIEYS